jgi:diadenosine tetraphosphate (Ap4A) HIT family hydrolase
MNQDRHVHIQVHPRYRASRRWAGLDFDDPDYGSPLASAPRRLSDQQLHALATAITSRVA